MKLKIAAEKKDKVRIQGVCAELAFVMPIVDSVFRDAGYEAVITSVLDGKHMRSSAHYTGRAVDLRTHTVPKAEQGLVAAALKLALGDDFDVILERNHIHLEYDVKQPL